MNVDRYHPADFAQLLRALCALNNDSCAGAHVYRNDVVADPVLAFTATVTCPAAPTKGQLRSDLAIRVHMECGRTRAERHCSRADEPRARNHDRQSPCRSSFIRGKPVILGVAAPLSEGFLTVFRHSSLKPRRCRALGFGSSCGRMTD